MPTLFLDFETRSRSDLKQVGAWAYSEHPSTEVICACWAIESGPVERWGNPAIGYQDSNALNELLDAAEDPAVLFEAHNVAFEYAAWHNVCVARYGWPAIPLHRWRDTMAVASYYAMPAKLDDLARALGLPGKDPAGSRLITKYSKLHLKTAKAEIPPEDRALWLQYCAQDVDQERQVANLLGELPEDEERVFLHDLMVNLRGIALDAGGLALARRVVEQRAGDLETEFEAMTGLRPGQRDKVLAWLGEHGLALPDLRGATIDELLDDGEIEGQPAPFVSRDAKRALEMRRQHARASTKKLDAMLRQRGSDGRARFQTRYHGAATGRSTGTGFQPLNLVRNWEDVDPEQLVRDVKLGDARWLDCLYGDAMAAIGRASRHWLVAKPGHRIMAGDFSSIEAVVNACLAGEKWKIQLFRDKGDPYVTFASKATGRAVLPKSHPDVTMQDLSDRQKIGKPGELAFGYQGAVAAWRKFDRSDAFTDQEIVAFVRDWRELHPRIVEQWKALESAALEAVTWPGCVTGWEDQELFERVDGWLTMILPDGKRLWYWAPEIRMLWPQWHDPANNEECASGDCTCTKRPQVTYMAQKEGRWKRVASYGGKWTENRVQAVSRQILKPIELRVEAAGYPQILGVYDEIVCEVPDGFGSVAELKRLMEEPAGAWCAGWPVRAEIWEGARYRK